MRIMLDVGYLAYALPLLKAEQLSMFGPAGMAPTGVGGPRRVTQVRAHTRITSHGATFVSPHQTHARTPTNAEKTAERARALAARTTVHYGGGGRGQELPAQGAKMLRTVTGRANDRVIHIPVQVQVDQRADGTFRVSRPTASGFDLSTENVHVRDVVALAVAHGAKVPPRGGPVFASVADAGAFVDAAREDGFVALGLSSDGEDLGTVPAPDYLVSIGAVGGQLPSFDAPGHQGAAAPPAPAPAPPAPKVDPIDHINDLVEGAGCSVNWRGNTCYVSNASGKRSLGEVFRRRDGTWGHKFHGGGVNAEKIEKGIDAFNTTLTPVAADPGDVMRRHAKAGTLALHYTDDQIHEAVRAGFLTESDAMNQDL